MVKFTIISTLREGEDTMKKHPSKNSLASGGEGSFTEKLST
jgi:hypothetical protein